MKEPDRRISFDRVLAAIVIGLLLVATAMTLRPFLPAILWAIVLAITAEPLHARIVRHMTGHPRSAALIASIIMVVIVILPALAMTRALVAYMPGVVAWVDQVGAGTSPVAPDEIRQIPAVGEFLAHNWEFLSARLTKFVADFKDDIEGWLAWALQQAETVGVFLFEFGFAIILAGVFLARQVQLSGFAHTFFHKIGGDLGVELLDHSVLTTRSTVRGVVGAAVAEALVAMFAYYIAGVPAWGLLGGLTFFAALVQIGAPLVWIPVAIWLLVQGELGWAIFMVAWGAIIVYAVENLARPLLTSKEARLPGLLIFVGVLGGLFAFGLIGVFLGPVILAVAYELIQVWFKRAEAAEARLATEGEDQGEATGQRSRRNPED